jgi:hypothetical protein
MDSAGTLRSTAIVQRNRHVTFIEFDTEMLAIDVKAELGYSLKGSAGRVWELLATPVSIDALCDQLCREFDVARDICLREVTGVLQDLRQAGLVQVSDAQPR